MNELRLAYERAVEAHRDAQHRLLAHCESAFENHCAWPAPADYEAVAALGKTAGTALRSYLDIVNVPRERAKSSAERKRLIERLSASERLWQPSPDDWLAAQNRTKAPDK